AQRALQSDLYREEACRLLMRLYAALGRPAAAQETYQELRQRLREEMGISPAAATRELAESLREGAPVPGLGRSAVLNEPNIKSPVQETVPTPDARPLPATRYPVPSASLPFQLTRFFGREDEIAQLEALLTAGARGQGSEAGE